MRAGSARPFPADAVPPDGPPPAEPTARAGHPPPVAPADRPAGRRSAARSLDASRHPAGRRRPGMPGPTPAQPPPGWQPPPGLAAPTGLAARRPRAGSPPPGGRAARLGRRRLAVPGWPADRPSPARTGYALAGLGRRLVARLIDIGAVLLLNAVVNGCFAYQWVEEFARSTASRSDQMATGGSATDVAAVRREQAGLLWVMLIVATAALARLRGAGDGRQRADPRQADHADQGGRRSRAPSRSASAGRSGAGARSACRRRPGAAPASAWLQLIDALSPLFDPPLRQAFHDKTRADGRRRSCRPPATRPVDVPTTRNTHRPEGRS